MYVLGLRRCHGSSIQPTQKCTCPSSYTTTGPPLTDGKVTTAKSGPADRQVAKPATITHPAGKGIAKL